MDSHKTVTQASHTSWKKHWTKWRLNVNTVIAIICMHAWIVRCIALLDIIKSNVLCCCFVSVDA